MELHLYFQVAAASLARPGEVVQVQNPAIQHNMAYCSEKQSVMIVWSHGGNQVAVTGSWDNWETVYGKFSDFIFMIDFSLLLCHELIWKICLTLPSESRCGVLAKILLL